MQVGETDRRKEADDICRSNKGNEGGELGVLDGLRRRGEGEDEKERIRPSPDLPRKSRFT